MDVDPCSAVCSPNFKHVQTLKGHSNAVATVKFSPGAGTLLASASADKTARIWETETGRELLVLQGHTQGLSDVSWSPDGAYLATASDDNTLKLWHAESGRCLKTLTGHTNYVFCCSFSPHGNLLASGSFDETLRVWDVRSGACLREVPAHSDPVTAVDFNYDGTLMVSSSLDGLCRLWDTQLLVKGSSQATPGNPFNTRRCLASTRQSSRLAGQQGVCVLYMCFEVCKLASPVRETGHCLKTLFDKESPPVSFVRFAPNGRYILSSSLDGKLRLWDFEKGRAVKVYQGHANKHFCLFSTFCTPSGKPSPRFTKRSRGQGALPRISPGPAPWIVTGSDDGNVFVYGLNDQQVLQVVRGEGGADGPAHADAVLCVDAHPLRPLLATCGHAKDCCIKLWAHAA
ncbi:hypothetical protein QJQ45_012119 [Haematococcus lacustris]|nr:hypothetical protein QJQ45_012119 [Haematococcus lacustris]